MIRLATISLLSLMLAVVASAGRGPSRKPDVTAVLIAGPLPAGTPVRYDRLEATVPDAFRYHLEYLLRERGDRFQLLQVPDSLSPLEALKSLDGRKFKRALYIRPSGRRESISAIRTDSHRRRYLVTFDDCLHVQVAFSIWNSSGKTWSQAFNGQLEDAARPVQTGPASATNRDNICEPYSAVVRRLADRVIAHLPPPARAATGTSGDIPAYVYIDTAGEETIAPSTARRIVQAASRMLARQFGMGIEPAAIRPLPAGLNFADDMHTGNRLLRLYLDPGGDTLVIAMVRQVTVEEYQAESGRMELGLTQLGRKRIVMNLMPAMRDQDSIWYVMDNALTLLHEAGHAFGAIHVADINSVMSPTAAWTGSSRFDTVNARIVRAALDGSLTFRDPANYLRFVARVIADSPYSLSDYPAFLYDYLNHGGNRRIRDTLRAAIEHEPLLMAVDGYGLLLAGDRKGAARLFRKAVRFDPHQAALYYYLSLTADSTEAAAWRRQALDMGYLPTERKITKSARSRPAPGRPAG